VEKARQELEERGDEGALWFLERLAKRGDLETAFNEEEWSVRVSDL
jgi:hypothetical protein